MTAPAQQRLAADPAVMRTWLGHLYSCLPGYISVCSDADRWAGRRFATDEAGIKAAVHYAVRLDKRSPKGIYTQVTTLREQPEEGRGGEDLAHALNHLWMDGDFGTIGHKPGLDDLPAPPDPDAVARVIADSGLPEPSGWTHSGGGYNPVWMLAEPRIIGDAEDRAWVKEVTMAWQVVAAAQAYRLGWSWDVEVGNLDRLMKLPGSINRKEGLERPTSIAPGTGLVYEFGDLAALASRLVPTAREVLAQAGRERQTRKNKRLGITSHPPRVSKLRTPRPLGSEGPLDVLADVWEPRDVLEAEGFTYEGQLGDGRLKFLRPTAGGDQPSSEYSVLADDHVAVNFSERAGLPTGALPSGSKLTVGTLYAHFHYAGDTSEAARDIMRAAAGRTTRGPADRLPQRLLDAVRQRCMPEPEAAHSRPKDAGGHLEAGAFEDLRLVEEDFERDDSGEYAPGPDEEPIADGQQDLEVRRLILTPASRIKIKPVRWLWDTTPAGAPPTSHGRIPMYSMAIAAGGPGLGKSQFAVWITARITRGELPGELRGKPRGVIYAATEDSWTYTIAPRLIAAGADLDLVFRVDVQDDERLHARLTLPIDISLIGNAAEAYSVALVVADPLLSFVDKSINDYRAAEVREALEPLIAAADRHHFTILGLAHFTKNGAADPLSRVAGSGAFGQLIRSLLAFAQQETDDGETEFVMSLEKNNLGRLGLPSFAYEIQPFTVPTEDGPSYVSRFVLGAESTTSVKEVMRAEGQPDDREAMNDAMAWLSAYLNDVGGSDMAREIKKNARKAMISDSAIDRAKLKLRLKSKQQGFGKDKAAHWYLPEAWPEDDADG